MLHPDHWHPNYKEIIDALKKQGFRAVQQNDFPEGFVPVIGSLAYMINDQGEIFSVNQVDGAIEREHPKPAFQMPPPGCFPS